MNKTTFEIFGIHCASCKILITDLLADSGIKVTRFDIDAQKQKGILEVDSAVATKKVLEIVKGAGDYKINVK